MAAIIEPRTHNLGATAFGPSRPPRHLSAVAVPVAAGPAGHGRAVPFVVERPVEPLLAPATVAAMIATVVVAALLALGIGGGAFSALVPAPGDAAATASGGRVVVVEPGDSVWSIARSVQPEGDVRPLVHRIIQANGGSPLQPGQQLVVPV